MIYYGLVVAIHEGDEHPLEIRKVNVVEGVGCALSNYTVRGDCMSPYKPDDYRGLIWDKIGDFPRWAVVIVHQSDGGCNIVEMVHMVDCLAI